MPGSMWVVSRSLQFLHILSRLMKLRTHVDLDQTTSATSCLGPKSAYSKV